MKRLALLLILFLIPLVAADIRVEPSSIEFSELGEQRSVDLEVNSTVTYEQAYLNENGSWEELTLQNNNKRGSWYLGRTTAAIGIREAQTRTQQRARIATYSCNWNGSWQCPTDWQITTVQTTHPQEEPPQEEPPQEEVPAGQLADFQALQALYESTNGAQWTENDGWADMSAETMNQAYGIETQTINDEERVVTIDLRYNNLQGSIDIPELADLKELRMFAVLLNNLDSEFPDAITQATNLEYLYLSGSDGTSNFITQYPHEEASDGGQTVHPGKHNGNENNIFRGPVPQNIDNLQRLKWFMLGWTDHIEDRDLIEANGITDVPETIWNIASLQGIYIYENWNIARSGNSLEFPDSLAHMENLTHVLIGGGSGTQWESDEEGFLKGAPPADMNTLTKIRQFSIKGHEVTAIADLSGTTELRSYSVSGTAFDDQPFPGWLVDGRNERLDSVSLGSGIGDTFPAGPEVIVNKGLTGEIPDVFAPGIDSFTVSMNKLTGSIPETFWTTNPGGGRKNNFYHNQLTSLGTTDLTHLRDTNHIRVSHNLISEPWPNLNWESPPPLQWVWFQYNKYVFKHMLYVPDNAPNGETIFELYQSLNIDNFNYAPQKPFGETNSYTRQAGQSLTVNDFSQLLEHQDNEYQWYKQDNPVSGQTSRELQYSNIQESNAGEYTLQVTNPGVPGLTLESRPITIQVTPAPQEPDPDQDLSDEILPNSQIISTEEGDIYFAEVARNIARPWALEQLPDGRLLVNSWHGTMHIVTLDGQKSEPLSNVPRVINERQGGLLDVALHPNFEQNNWVYITYSGIEEVEGEEKYMTHLARGKLINDDLEQVEVLFRGQPPTYSTRPRHFGSRITFDDEGHLFFGIGDRRNAGRAQNLDDHAGTIIRLHHDGSIPSDNPFIGQDGVLPEIYAYGVRNPQGIATHPTTGDIWENEHGPEGGDEVNIIYPGENYGWPLYTEGVNYGGNPMGADDPPEGTLRAIHWWIPSIAPSGMTFYSGDKLGPWKGDLFNSALAKEDRGHRLARLEITPSSVEHEEQFLIGEVGRIRDVREGNDEYIYIATDGGRIYRLGPFVSDT